jgi:N-acetylglucosaminyl-diphospho-decaprenol L-rhamnosyltransferase
VQLSIIIINYNVKYFLEHCLLSVIKACNNIDAEILVGDNNSTDGSEEYLADKFPSVNFFWNKTNPGFAMANNALVKLAKGEHILFLNPDTIVAEDCFTKCISFFERQKDCGALGVKMIDGCGVFLKESKRSLPTPAAGFYKISGLTKIFPSSKRFAEYYAGHLSENQNNITEVLAGAFMMLSKKAINITCGFDESFFMYGEDVDLSYRISKAGLNNYYFADTTIIHFKGESTQKKSATYNKYFYGAMKHFVDKHYSSRKTKHYLMRFAISFSKTLSDIKKNFLTESNHVSTKSKLKTVFYGTDEEKNSAKQLLKSSFFADIIQEFKTENEPLHEMITKYKPDKIIFCEGESSYKNIIEALQQIAPFCGSLFYSRTSNSIIGSDDKNKNGTVISNAQ